MANPFQPPKVTLAPARRGRDEVRGWPAVWLLMALGLLYALSIYTFRPVAQLVLVESELHLRGTYELLDRTFFVGLGAPVLAALAAFVVGGRWVLIGGFAIMVAGAIMLAADLMVPAYYTHRVGNGCVYMAGYVLAARQFELDDLWKGAVGALGFYVAVNIGAFAAAHVAGQLYLDHGLTLAFVPVIAVPTIALVLVIAINVSDTVTPRTNPSLSSVAAFIGLCTGVQLAQELWPQLIDAPSWKSGEFWIFLVPAVVGLIWSAILAIWWLGAQGDNHRQPIFLAAVAAIAAAAGLIGRHVLPSTHSTAAVLTVESLETMLSVTSFPLILCLMTSRFGTRRDYAVYGLWLLLSSGIALGAYRGGDMAKPLTLIVVALGGLASAALLVVFGKRLLAAKGGPP